jgi:hypothetical protein
MFRTYLGAGAPHINPRVDRGSTLGSIARRQRRRSVGSVIDQGSIMERKWSIYRVMAALLVADLVLFACSGIPAVKNAKHGAKYVIGDILWFGFLGGALALIVLAVVAVVSRRGRTATA